MSDIAPECSKIRGDRLTARPPMPRTRVLHICHGYSGPFLDVARQYNDALARHGYEVHTVYLLGRPEQEIEERTGGDIVRFLGQQSSDISGFKIGSILAIRKLAACGDYSFCVTHRFKPAFIACVATGLPVMAVFHAYGTFQRRSRRLFAKLFARRLLLLGVSDAVRDDIRAALAGVGPRVETFHNRIDVETERSHLLDREPARQALGLETEAFVFGNVGRLHPDKDQASLLKGFAAAKRDLPTGSRLVIIGSGKLKKVLHELAEELGLTARDIVWIEHLPDVRRYFRAFDAFVLSSDHEPFGMVVLEAMLAGVPVVGTRAGGVPEILGVQHPLLFPVGDVSGLSQALVRISAFGTDRRHALTETADERLRTHFSYEAAVIRMGELLRLMPGVGMGVEAMA